MARNIATMILRQTIQPQTCDALCIGEPVYAISGDHAVDGSAAAVMSDVLDVLTERPTLLTLLSDAPMRVG